MEVKLIGTGSIGATSFSASTIIDKKILIDTPNGLVKLTKKNNINILDIEVILITHLHGDHFMELPFIMLEKYFNKDNNEVLVYGPIGLEKKVKQLFTIAFPDDYDLVTQETNFQFIEFNNNQVYKFNDYKFYPKLVEHGNLKPAYGIIVEYQNKRIGFSGDSTICDSIKDIIKASDISILDTSLPDIGNRSHMGLIDIEALRNTNKNKTIIATHMHDKTRLLAQNKKITNLIIPLDGYTFNL